MIYSFSIQTWKCNWNLVIWDPADGTSNQFWLLVQVVAVGGSWKFPVKHNVHLIEIMLDEYFSRESLNMFTLFESCVICILADNSITHWGFSPLVSAAECWPGSSQLSCAQSPPGAVKGFRVT